MQINANAWHLRMIRYTFGFTPPNLCVYFWSMVMAAMLVWPVGLVRLLAMPMTPVGRLSLVGFFWKPEYEAIQVEPPDDEDAYRYAMFATGLMLITAAFFLAVIARGELDWVANLFFGLGSLAGALVLIFVVTMFIIGVWKPVGSEPKPYKRGRVEKAALAAAGFASRVAGGVVAPLVIFFFWVLAAKRRVCPLIFVVESTEA